MEYFLGFTLIELAIMLLICRMWYVNGKEDGFEKGYKKAVDDIQSQHKTNK